MCHSCYSRSVAMKTARAELLQVLAELSAVFPDWRFGQLVANVATAARGPQVEALGDSENEELLAAARRLLERHRGPERSADAHLRLGDLRLPAFRSAAAIAFSAALHRRSS